MNREEPNLSDNGNRDSVSLTTKPRLPLGVYLTIGIAIILSLAALLIGFLSRFRTIRLSGRRDRHMFRLFQRRSVGADVG